jgi:phosphoadenosine phosphosulfate reductase
MFPDYKLSLQEVWDRIKGWSYEQKLEHAEMVVKEAVDNHEKLAVACSFGKDSMVVLHLTLKHKPGVFVSFQNTLCQERGVYRLKKRLTDEWNLNLIESKPGNFKDGTRITFWSCVDKWGFPGLKAGYKKTRVTGRNYPKCCYYLKEKPAKLLYKKHAIEGVILGLQAVESNNRMHLTAKMGCMYYAKTTDLWKYHPIIFWNDKDVWRYIKENTVPYPEEYNIEGVDRLGCKFCTAYSSWESKMSKLHPRIYRKIKRMMGKPLLTEFF